MCGAPSLRLKLHHQHRDIIGLLSRASVLGNVRNREVGQLSCGSALIGPDEIDQPGISVLLDKTAVPA